MRRVECTTIKSAEEVMTRQLSTGRRETFTGVTVLALFLDHVDFYNRSLYGEAQPVAHFYIEAERCQIVTPGYH